MKNRTIIEAAIEVLRREDKPLSIRDIYSKIIEQDLYRFNALDPENIVKGLVRRHCQGLEFPSASQTKYFQILRDGTYWIKDTIIPGGKSAGEGKSIVVTTEVDLIKSTVLELKEIHIKHTQALKKQILTQLTKIDPELFEKFSRKLLEVYGFKEVKVTKPGKDGGIDGHGKLKVGITHLHVAFQCKRWKSNVGRTEIDKFRGAIQGEFEQGIFFTTANFSKDAQNVTRKSGAVPIILIDGISLVDIMIDKKFGIESENIPVYINALDRALTDSD